MTQSMKEVKTMVKYCRECPAEIPNGRKELCNDCRAANKRASVIRANKKDRVKIRGTRVRVTKLTEERIRKAAELRKAGYDLPWDSSNGFE